MKKRRTQPLPLLQTGVGTFKSSMAVAGFILGYCVDYYLGTVPLFLLVFGFLGLLGGILKAYRFLTLTGPQIKNEAGKRSSSKYAPIDDISNRNRFDRRRGF